MRQLAPDLWIVERPQRFAGFELGTRMTVVRLASGDLFLHSPVSLTPDLAAELTRLGRPRIAVAPNLLHHLYAGEYVAAYPELKLHLAPGLARKRPDLRAAGVLDGQARHDWSEQIDEELVRGYPMLNEVAFCDRASRTLMVSDLLFNIHAESPFATRLAFRLVGGYGHCGPSALERFLIRDRAAARASLERILTWDFDRIVLAHGRIVENGGHTTLRDGYGWLLR